MTAPVLPPGARAWTTRHRPDGRLRDPRRGHAWPPGPWDDEPDKVSWTDDATGRPCLIVRGPMGALCGYVAVDPGHPLHGAGYDDAGTGDIEVHGGLTFASDCEHSDDEATGICHVPQPGQPDDVWWFGFDCSHMHDMSPGMLTVYAQLGHTEPSWPGTCYKTVGYVAAECARLAAQLAH